MFVGRGLDGRQISGRFLLDESLFLAILIESIKRFHSFERQRHRERVVVSLAHRADAARKILVGRRVAGQKQTQQTAEFRHGLRQRFLGLG